MKLYVSIPDEIIKQTQMKSEKDEAYINTRFCHRHSHLNKNIRGIYFDLHESTLA